MNSNLSREINELKVSEDELIDNLQQFTVNVESMNSLIRVKLKNMIPMRDDYIALILNPYIAQEKENRVGLNETIESLKKQVTNSEDRLNKLEIDKSGFQIGAKLKLVF